ncbi:RNA exonuclease 3 [Podospora aff. communis PSN243]|uniref:RNA exonuclease 3 n=1 Tax=Podospora aff. communis PSN243 TaxID=3040156 RepID=A0AAV9GJD2_9PEZI|nr:RNA exonuclease 3 [Podospora aff. communis PSN243]
MVGPSKVKELVSSFRLASSGQYLTKFTKEITLSRFYQLWTRGTKLPTFAMDAVLRNFKSIPCPQGDGCAQPSCQWQHSWDKSSTADVPAESRDRGSRSGFDGSQDEDGPRKRIKVASEPHGLPSQSQPLTATKPVSPPPLKRKLTAAYSAPTASSETTQGHQTTKASASSPGVSSGHMTWTAFSSGGHSHSPTASTASPGTPKPHPIAKTTDTPRPLALSVAGGKNPFASPVTSTGATHSPISSTTTKSITPPEAGRPAHVTKKAPVRAPESLNPRHLKTSPAPHEFRYSALKMLHDQFARLNNELIKSSDPSDKKLVLSTQELIWLALDKEEKLAKGQQTVYKNLIKNMIGLHKKYNVSDWKKALIEENMQKQKALDAASGRSGPKNGPPAQINTGLDSSQEVEMLKYLVTPIEKLAKHGYVPVAPTTEEIAKARDGEEASQGWEECDRCKSRFQVFPGRKEDGSLTSGGHCQHHPGRLYSKERSVGQTGPSERRYRCCDAPIGEPGCERGLTHVFKVNAPSRLAALIPFAETPPNEAVPKCQAVCFDCEMGYTSRGMELIRLTATRFPDGSELLDVLVHPVGEILDLNSRYSGVLPEHIRDAVNVDDVAEARRIIKEHEEAEKARGIAKERGNAGEGRTMKKRMQIVSSPVVARDLLFSLIAPDTPLIGHGLENDLNAMRMVHPTIIDTILLYPHSRGLPLRNGLKVLARHHLNRDIQVEQAGVVGHDSGEDARAAGDLVRLKVAQKWKAMMREGWSLAEGKIVPPPQGMKRSASDAET